MFGPLSSICFSKKVHHLWFSSFNLDWVLEKFLVFNIAWSLITQHVKTSSSKGVSEDTWKQNKVKSAEKVKFQPLCWRIISNHWEIVRYFGGVYVCELSVWWLSAYLSKEKRFINFEVCSKWLQLTREKVQLYFGNALKSLSLRVIVPTLKINK